MSDDGGITRLSIGFNKIAAVVKVAPRLSKLPPLYGTLCALPKFKSCISLYTDVGGKSQDIFQELTVNSGHTETFFLLDIWKIVENMAIIGCFMLHY